MKRWLLLSLLTLITLSAHDIITTNLTFTRDITRIFARRCLSCHSAGDSIPLLTYEQSRPWAVSIKEQVLSRRMPPWGAVKGFGHLSPDNSLTQEEIMIIASWVVGGAPKGSEAFVPKGVSENLARLPKLSDALIVNGKATLRKPLAVSGIRPLASGTVASARITASFPDGHVEPLLWLYQYDPAADNKILRFREPLSLPRGAVLEAGASLEFALETKDP
jgi:hypothetical protein